jgi:hypothetical protein
MGAMIDEVKSGRGKEGKTYSELHLGTGSKHSDQVC